VTDPRVGELAELLVDRCLDVRPRWQVSVRATPLARPLVTEVARAIARRGAYYLPRINWGPDRFRADLDWALEAPLELLGELPPIERYAAEQEDARLTIRSPEDVHAGAELDPARRVLLQQAMAPASKRARNLEVRWAVVEYPTAAAAEQAGMSLAEYTDFVFDACLLDWDAEEERLREIKARFDRGSTVRIVGADTDLTLGIEGREGVVSAAFRLVFSGGKIVEATAEEGEEFLRQVLATDAGASRLGELGLGCNPRITRFTRNVLFDEKIDGTVHLAVGASYTYTGGRNESAVHWDLVKDLRRGGELSVDGEIVQRDGDWLI
jgi:aminopeptidase